MKIFNKFVWSKKEPSNTNDIWFDGSVFSLYKEDKWKAFTLPLDAAEKVAEVIKNASNVYQEKLFAGNGIKIENNVISTSQMFQIVDSLPPIGEYNTIYLLYSKDSEYNNQLIEYIYVDNKWEQLGEFKVEYNDTELRESIEDLEKRKVNKTDMATINGQSILNGGNIVIKGGEGSYDDTELREAIERLEDDKANATDVENELTKKVDKVEGKGLSTNDYTTEEKNKLASLQNYDDTELRNEVAQKASTEGYYPKLEVGKADNLPDRVDVTEGAITFRESAGEGNSIEDGTCEVKELCGNTLVWNQQLKYALSQADLGKQGWWSRYTGNGVAQLDGRKVTFFAGDGYYPSIAQACKIVKGHAYLISFDFTTEFTDRYKRAYRFAFTSDAYGNIAQSIYSPQDGLTSGHCDSFAIANDNYSYFSWSVSTIDLSSTPASAATLENYQLIDLTQMFGSGNEPTTIEEFNARKPIVADEYAYNEGEIVNVNINGIKSVNDNAWDEKWELGYFVSSSGMPSSATDRIRCVNPIHILPNQQYHFSLVGTEAYAFFYDENMEYISYKNMNVGLFTTPSNAKWMRFYVGKSYGTTYKNDICIRLAHSGYKTDYVPHEEDTMLIDTTKYFPQGMNGINGVSDSLSMNEKVQRFGVIDMGTLAWQKYAYGDGIFRVKFDGYKTKYTNSNLLCKRYQTTTERDVDKTIRYSDSYYGSYQLAVVDSAYTDVASFKASLQGVMLYYELDEPIVEEIYPPLNLSYKVWDFGTEEILTEKSAPLITKAIYGFNATDTIRGNKAKIAQNTEEIVKLRNEIAQAIGNVINGEY